MFELAASARSALWRHESQVYWLRPQRTTSSRSRNRYGKQCRV